MSRRFISYTTLKKRARDYKSIFAFLTATAFGEKMASLGDNDFLDDRLVSPNATQMDLPRLINIFWNFFFFSFREQAKFYAIFFSFVIFLSFLLSLHIAFSFLSRLFCSPHFPSFFLFYFFISVNIIYTFRVFHIIISWWFFTVVWETASLFMSLGLFSVFQPFSVILSFG